MVAGHALNCLSMQATSDSSDVSGSSASIAATARRSASFSPSESVEMTPPRFRLEAMCSSLACLRTVIVCWSRSIRRVTRPFSLAAAKATDAPCDRSLRMPAIWASVLTEYWMTAVAWLLSGSDQQAHAATAMTRPRIDRRMSDVSFVVNGGRGVGKAPKAEGVYAENQRVGNYYWKCATIPYDVIQRPCLGGVRVVLYLAAERE